MKETSVVILLGGNQGKPEKLIEKAIELLGVSLGKVVRESSFYKTEAWGKEDQPPFINKAVVVETKIAPHPGLEICLDIEQKLGRERDDSTHWGPRPIDIDILFYGDLQLFSETLTVPHPLLHQRNFALEPLNEIIPDFVHPSLNLPIRQLLKNSSDDKKVQKI